MTCEFCQRAKNLWFTELMKKWKPIGDIKNAFDTAFGNGEFDKAYRQSDGKINYSTHVICQYCGERYLIMK